MSGHEQDFIMKDLFRLVDKSEIDEKKKLIEKYSADIDLSARTIRLDLISMTHSEVRQVITEIRSRDLCAIITYLRCPQVNAVLYRNLTDQEYAPLNEKIEKLTLTGVGIIDLIMSLKNTCKILALIDRSATPVGNLH